MYILPLIASVILIVFTSQIVKYFGIPDSYSNTFYLLNEKKKGLGILFPIIIAIFTFLMLPKWFVISDVINNTFTFLCFLAGGGLLMVAASPFFKEQSKECGSALKNLIYRSFHGQGLVHTIGALVAMSASIIWCILYNQWVAIIFALLLTISLMISTKNVLQKIVFWVEFFIFTLMIIILI